MTAFFFFFSNLLYRCHTCHSFQIRLTVTCCFSSFTKLSRYWLPLQSVMSPLALQRKRSLTPCITDRDPLPDSASDKDPGSPRLCEGPPPLSRVTERGGSFKERSHCQGWSRTTLFNGWRDFPRSPSMCRRQVLEGGGAAPQWRPLTACRTVSAMATAATPGRWGPCVCWWEGRRPPPLSVTSTPVLPRPWLAERPRCRTARAASLSTRRQVPSTPAARMPTLRTWTVSTLRQTLTLTRLTAADSRFSQRMKLTFNLVKPPVGFPC